METMDQVGKAGGEAAQRIRVIFVGDIQEKWDSENVKASDIMTAAGVSQPSNFVLEALNHKGGDPVAEFGPDQIVDHVGEEDKHRKFFRVTPGGGGRS